LRSLFIWFTFYAMNETEIAPFEIADLPSIPGVPCPCGTSRRAFRGPMSLHLVEISRESRTHYHKKLTEVYYFLEGEGQMELDGKLYPAKPGMAVLVRPGTRHRALPVKGRMKILNAVVPAFDPDDEWYD